MEEEEVTYKRETKAKAREIRRMEKEGLKLQKERRRDVGRLRNHLVTLTASLDDITNLHVNHSQTLLRESQETSAKIVDTSSVLVRAEVEIFESLARKGWSGGGLDELLEKSSDPFQTEADTAGANGSREIFSILPTKSILPTNPNDPGSPGLGRPRHDSLGVAEGDRYQSLTRALSDCGEADQRSIFSTEGHFNNSRGVRPFSPPPSDRRAFSVDSPAKVTEQGGEQTPRPSIVTESESEERGRQRRWSVTEDYPTSP